MVDNESVLKNRADVKIWRTCDECSLREEVFMNSVVRGRKRRESNLDLCKSCSALPKYRVSVFALRGEDSINWNGGKRVSGGYLQRYLGNGKYRCEQRFVIEDALGRELSGQERVHHINMDKSDNRLCNLYVCRNRSEQMLCHSSLERIGYGLLGTKVWFDRATGRYGLYPTTVDPSVEVIRYPNFRTVKRRWTRYATTRIADGSTVAIHKLVAEQIVGRRLFADEHVHHIDGNGLNNEPSNLVVLTRKEHRHAHHSLQRCVATFLDSGEVSFRTGEYFLKEKQ